MLTGSWWKYLGGLHSAHCIQGRWEPRQVSDLGRVRALDVFPDGRACGESLGGVPREAEGVTGVAGRQSKGRTAHRKRLQVQKGRGVFQVGCCHPA